jgi:uncharacterized protein (TIGR02444 family)
MSESFWDFSIRTYKTENAAKACLSLQDERSVDVNILLYCCWFGHTRGRLPLDTFQEIFDFSENWASRVVRPLRGVRTWMKSEGCPDPRMPTESCMQLREKIKGLELNAEKIQQSVLESLALSFPEITLELPAQLEAIKNNIFQYFDTVNISNDDFIREKLSVVIAAGVTDFTEDKIQSALV